MAVALLIAVMRKVTVANRYVRTRRERSDPWDFPLGYKVRIFIALFYFLYINILS